ncbi:MAG: aminotransferase class V-fold PLP-dependent enzyme, partial [Pyrinomonadaceae bacterium]|nr:aminotransferase class V-fold PLP-dependent enzyme [Pyrinomonadaceae bacterium]
MDHSATTPVDERVVETMLPFLTQKFGNASSVHTFGQEARAAVDKARREAAKLIGARANEIVFTSGGTEANNLAVRGIAEIAAPIGRHLITSAIEHPAVREVCDYLERQGWTITRLPVYEEGIVRIEDVRAALRDDTTIITIMLANNETGTLQPVAEIGDLVRELRTSGRRHLWFHTDAVQAAGRMEVDVEKLGCDL